MRILGIDPGYAITGYSILDYKGNNFNLIDANAIITKAGGSLPIRLAKIYNDLKDIIGKYNPDVISVEELFFNQNVKTAITVAHGRGAVLVAAAKSDLPVFEYTPLQVKQAVVGYGRADKIQVQKMVKTILKLQQVPKLDDITDAIAVGICHGHSAKFSTKI